MKIITRKGYAEKTTAERVGRGLASQYKAIASNLTIKEAYRTEGFDHEIWWVLRIELKNGTWAKFTVRADKSLGFITCSKGSKFFKKQGCKTADDLISKLQSF